MSKRPHNECIDCGYTWYPRGKDISLSCPRCSSGLVQRSAQQRLADAWDLFKCALLVLFFLWVLITAYGP